jgi:hypothetical protein
MIGPRCADAHDLLVLFCLIVFEQEKKQTGNRLQVLFVNSVLISTQLAPTVSSHCGCVLCQAAADLWELCLTCSAGVEKSGLNPLACVGRTIPKSWCG